MGQINVVLANSNTGKTVNVEIPDNVTIGKLLPILSSKMGIPASIEGTLVSLNHVKTGYTVRLNDKDTLAKAGVNPGDNLVIDWSFVAGDISGLDMNSVKDFPISEFRKSGEVPFVMMIRRLEEIEQENRKLRVEGEREKRKSTDRLTATILLLLSQIILSIGANLVSRDYILPGILVISVSILQSLLAIYLSFRRINH